MRASLLAVLALLAAPAVAAVHYRGTILSADGGITLVLHIDHGAVMAPRTAKGQYGFRDPRIAPDGRTVGWMELVRVAGTTGPIPGDLIIFRDGRVVRAFDPGLAVVYRWTFADGGTAVAYATSSLHTPTGFHYELRRIADGHLLGSFRCGRKYAGTPPDGMLTGQWTHRGEVPAWVWPIAEACPARSEAHGASR